MIPLSAANWHSCLHCSLLQNNVSPKKQKFWLDPIKTSTSAPPALTLYQCCRQSKIQPTADSSYSWVYSVHLLRNLHIYRCSFWFCYHTDVLRLAKISTPDGSIQNTKDLGTQSNLYHYMQKDKISMRLNYLISISIAEVIKYWLQCSLIYLSFIF